MKKGLQFTLSRLMSKEKNFNNNTNYSFVKINQHLLIKDDKSVKTKIYTKGSILLLHSIPEQLKEYNILYNSPNVSDVVKYIEEQYGETITYHTKRDTNKNNIYIPIHHNGDRIIEISDRYYGNVSNALICAAINFLKNYKDAE